MKDVGDIPLMLNEPKSTLNQAREKLTEEQWSRVIAAFREMLLAIPGRK